MRPRLSYRDRIYLAYLATVPVMLAVSVRYWWKQEA